MSELAKDAVGVSCTADGDMELHMPRSMEGGRLHMGQALLVAAFLRAHEDEEWCEALLGWFAAKKSVVIGVSHQDDDTVSTATIDWSVTDREGGKH